jgi:hypothetical protein
MNMNYFIKAFLVSLMAFQMISCSESKRENETESSADNAISSITNACCYDSIKSYLVNEEDSSQIYLSKAFYKQPDFAAATKNIVACFLKKQSKENGVKDIDKVELIEKTCLFDNAIFDIYKIKLSDKLPEEYHKDFYVIYNLKDSLGYFVYVDSLVFIKSKITDKCNLIAGTFRRRNIGHFRVYQLKGNKLSLWESEKVVYNYTTDCISFENGALDFKNVDLNSDGFLDLEFTGVRNFYCEGLEEGPSRETKSPVKREQVKFTYFFNPKDGRWVDKLPNK